MIEIKKQVEQIKILDKVVDLKPITKASVEKIQNLRSNKENLSFDDFEEILKIGIGEDAFKEVFPSDEETDITVMIEAALAVYGRFIDTNVNNMNKFSNKYSPNRAARRAEKNN